MGRCGIWEYGKVRYSGCGIWCGLIQDLFGVRNVLVFSCDCSVYLVCLNTMPLLNYDSGEDSFNLYLFRSN